MEMIIEFLLEILAFVAYDNLEELGGKDGLLSKKMKFLLTMLFLLNMIIWFVLVGLDLLILMVISKEFELANLSILIILIPVTVFMTIRTFNNFIYLKKLFMKNRKKV